MDGPGPVARQERAVLFARRADGISPDAGVAVETMARILDYAAAEPTVYLPTHDPEAAARLRAHACVLPLAAAC